MERSGPRRSDGDVAAPVVRIDTDAARGLARRYRNVGSALWDAHLSVGVLLRDAADLLHQPVLVPPFAEIGLRLGRDADDLEWRVDFVEATDGFDLAASRRAGIRWVRDWESREANDLTFDQLAVLLSRVGNQDELERLLTWMLTHGSVPGSAFERADILADQPIIPLEYRTLFAGALITAYERGWRGDDGQLQAWLAAGMVTYGELSDETAVELGRVAFDADGALANPTTPNPFAIDRDAGLFAPFATHFVDEPATGQKFVNSLLLDFTRTGDTPLDMHEDGSPRPTQLADIVVAAGTWGPLDERAEFVDRLVRVINADRDTNGPVFWATWTVHADLALEHDIVTTEPTFEQHHLMPDFVRPTWEHHWHEHVSPFALRNTFEFVQTKKAEAKILHQVMNPSVTINDWLIDRFSPKPVDPYNDAGGTYTSRPKENFRGLPFPSNSASRGRHVLTHALEDSSDRGDIGQDEFAIIDHGVGADGRPTYTVNLPGVIDLSNPVPGWDPEHMSVRDMDMAALLSATSTRVEDNLYAQMVQRALRVSEVPLGSNLLLVGHSFGADTVADLAADDWFTGTYNVTHVVAAAYDSVPQLAHISPDIDVLVLQNEDDKAILLESTQRHSAMSFDSISINTFAHEVRRFDGGWGADVGHHQDRYISYLQSTDDAELTRFFESLTATGYGNSGTSVAIDVTLDQNLVNR